MATHVSGNNSGLVWYRGGCQGSHFAGRLMAPCPGRGDFVLGDNNGRWACRAHVASNSLTHFPRQSPHKPKLAARKTGASGCHPYLSLSLLRQTSDVLIRLVGRVEANSQICCRRSCLSQCRCCSSICTATSGTNGSSSMLASHNPRRL